MTAAGWIEIALYVALLTAITPLLGGYMARVYRGEVGIGLVERVDRRRSAATRAGLEGYAKSVLVFSAALRSALRDPAHPGHPPVQPDDFDSRRTTSRSTRRRRSSPTRTGSSTRGETTLSNFSADGRPGRPELRLGGGRHRRRDRVHPRARRPLGHDARQLLRRPRQDARLRAAADLGRRRPRPRLAGRHPVAERRPGRLAGGHQGARHQRRRLLQRQLGASVREPDVALELRRDAADPRDPGRAHLRLRPDGRQPPPGLGDLRRDARRCSSSASSSSRSPRTTATPAMHAAGVARLQHGGQGAALRHRLDRALGRRHHGRLVRRRQRRHGVADRHRRRSSRWPTCRPAR